MTELISFNVKLTNPFCRTCFSMGDLRVYVSVHPSERTFRVKRFSFVTALCFIPLRYIINLLVKELIALNPYGNLKWDVAPKPKLLEPSSVHPSFRQHVPWVSCERNSSYSFVPIILKLCMCFRHGMKMCMWFGCNCQIIFCHFLHIGNLVIFHPQYIDNGCLL